MQRQVGSRPHHIDFLFKFIIIPCIIPGRRRNTRTKRDTGAVEEVCGDDNDCELVSEKKLTTTSAEDMEEGVEVTFECESHMFLVHLY